MPIRYCGGMEDLVLFTRYQYRMSLSARRAMYCQTACCSIDVFCIACYFGFHEYPILRVPPGAAGALTAPGVCLWT